MHRGESAIKGLEDSVSTKMYDLENQVKALLEENLKVQERMSAEIEKLRSELKEKKILLAAYEKAAWRSIGRPKFWRRILGS